MAAEHTRAPSEQELLQSNTLPSKVKPPLPEYAPGRLIVKLKDGADPASLAPLNRQFGVTGSGALFPKTPSAQERLETLRRERAGLEGKAHGGWYWWGDRDSEEAKEYQARIEREKKRLDGQIRALEELASRLERRQVRAPESAVAPSLEGALLLTADEKADIPAMVTAYRSNPAVAYAEPDYVMKVQAFPQTLPNDTYVDPDQNGTWSTGAWGQSYEDLWGLKKIQADKAWPISQGEGVVVAVIDTGVDYTHPDLAANIWVNPGEDLNGNGVVDGSDFNGVDDDGNGYADDIRGWDFAAGHQDPLDRLGHGTHVAGTIAAAGNNGMGVTGVSPRSRVMPVKGLGDSGGGYLSKLAQAVRYATDNGADILSNSWGAAGKSSLLEEVFDYAHSQGALSTAAAGNEGSDVGDFTPANIPTVISVAASTQNDEKAYFSNYGFQVDLAAPGGGYPDELGSGRTEYNILSTMKEGSLALDLPALRVADSYLRLAGTSMACPHVSGVAALLVSRYPSDSADAIRVRMKAAADPLPPSQAPFGVGRVNAWSALVAAPRPYFEIQDVRLAESAGDGDQIPESGERIQVTVALRNLWAGAQSVTAAVSTASPEIVSIPVATAALGGIDQGQTKEAGPFVFQVGRLTSVVGARFSLTIQAGGLVQSMPIEVRLGARRLTNRYELHPAFGIPEALALAGFRGSFPDIAGDKVVWSDNRHGNSDIYLFDLKTNTERRITTDPADQVQPSVFGDLVVWSDNRHGNWDLYLYDLRTGQERRLTDSPLLQYAPAIEGDEIVWEESSSEDVSLDDYRSDIYYLRYLPGGPLAQPTQISRSGQATVPALDAESGKVVWSVRGPGGSWLGAYDLRTGIETSIRTGLPVSQVSLMETPAIDGHRVVYLSDEDGPLAIHLYDFQTEAKRRISSGLGVEPDISGNRVVWYGPMDGKERIFLHNLQDGKGRHITGGTTNQRYPAISGDHVVWVELDGDDSLYLTDLSQFDPPPSPIMIYRPQGSQWHVDRDGDHQADRVFAYGDSKYGDVPLAGDVNGDGRLDFIVYRPFESRWFIDLNQDQRADLTFVYGDRRYGDIPVVGDVDGDGRADFMVYRGGQWHVDLNQDQRADLAFNYGTPYDVPVVGDVDGDGRVEFMVYRGGQWHVDLNRDQRTDQIFWYGDPRYGDRPVAGDINRDGRDDLIIYRRGQWHVDTDGDHRADILFGYGVAGDVPLVGKGTVDAQ